MGSPIRRLRSDLRIIHFSSSASPSPLVSDSPRFRWSLKHFFPELKSQHTSSTKNSKRTRLALNSLFPLQETFSVSLFGLRSRRKLCQSWGKLLFFALRGTYINVSNVCQPRYLKFYDDCPGSRLSVIPISTGKVCCRSSLPFNTDFVFGFRFLLYSDFGLLALSKNRCGRGIWPWG